MNEHAHDHVNVDVDVHVLVDVIGFPLRTGITALFLRLTVGPVAL
jgi:hypothetical protein